MNDTAWMQSAACLGADPRIFDPSTSKSKSGGTEWRAFCDNCPVRNMCVQFALDNEVEGYWGSTPAERETIKALVPRTIRQTLYSDQPLTLLSSVEVSMNVELEPPLSSGEVYPYPAQQDEDYWEHVRPRKDSTVLECIRALDDLLESLLD